MSDKYFCVLFLDNFQMKQNMVELFKKQQTINRC